MLTDSILVHCKQKKNMNEQENEWIKNNNINLENLNDFNKNIAYRNKKFLNEVISNPIFTLKFFIKKVTLMAILSPTKVQKKFYAPWIRARSKK